MRKPIARLSRRSTAKTSTMDRVVKIEKLLPVERDAIVEAHKAGDPFNNIHDAEQYYETRYGSSFK